ncbi:hypothetical protein [Roseobacter sp.]|uniref:hypothetical protein n=1 Tax=Roseobacter sp. TaxID=1907202 RepID=UPI00329A21A1
MRVILVSAFNSKAAPAVIWPTGFTGDDRAAPVQFTADPIVVVHVHGGQAGAVDTVIFDMSNIHYRVEILVNLANGDSENSIFAALRRNFP